MPRIVALFALMLLTVCAPASCRQAAAQPAPVVSGKPLEGWHVSRDWSGWLIWYERGVMKAGYRPETEEYCTYDPAARFWRKAPPPWKANPKASPAQPDALTSAEAILTAIRETVEKQLKDWKDREPGENFGLDTSKLSAAADRYLLNGKTVDRDAALKAVAGGTLADDSAKQRLTLIGSEEDRKAVLDDFSKAPLAEWKDKLLVQSYPPDHWAVARVGFKTDGKPSIYLQATDGKVLHRQADYEGGAVALAQAIRKADPLYDPEKDPDARKPKKPDPVPPAPIPSDSQGWLAQLKAWLEKQGIPPWVAMVVVAVLGLYLFRDKLPKPAFARPLREGYQPIAPYPGWKPGPPPHGGSAINSGPTLQHSRPDLSLTALIEADLERQKREDAEAVKRAEARAATKTALKKFLES